MDEQEQVVFGLGVAAVVSGAALIHAGIRGFNGKLGVKIASVATGFSVFYVGVKVVDGGIYLMKNKS